MHSTLYELTSDMAELLDMLYDDEADTQVVLDTMEGIGMQIEDKADEYAKVILQLTYDAEARKKEADRLNNAARVLMERASRIKETLKTNLEYIGKTKFKTDLFAFSVCNNGGKQPLTIDKEIDEIPQLYLIPQPPIVNTELVREALDNDSQEAQRFAHYEPRGRHLRIK